LTPFQIEFSKEYWRQACTNIELNTNFDFQRRIIEKETMYKGTTMILKVLWMPTSGSKLVNRQLNIDQQLKTKVECLLA